MKASIRKAARQIEWNTRRAWTAVDNENAYKGDYSVKVAEKAQLRKDKEIDHLRSLGYGMIEIHAMFDGFRFKK